VKVAVELGHLCGITSRFHDGPLFDIDSANRGKRPADWLEQGGEITPADSAKFYLGRCCDMTYVTGDAEAAQLRKHVKYKDPMAELKSYALTVFAVNYEGDISSGGKEALRRWAVNLTRHRKLAADLAGNPTKETTAAFATGFAMVTALQVASYVMEASGPPRAQRARPCRQPIRYHGAPPATRPCPPIDIDNANLSGPAARVIDIDSVSTANKLPHDAVAVSNHDRQSSSSIVIV
jgi:hypothetical protein